VLEVRRHRRLISYFFLPTLAGMMLALIAGMNLSKRATMISQLSNVVATGSSEEVTTAIQQMASMPRPPLATLVDAAAVPNQSVATAAQSAIDRVLASLGAQIERERNINVAADQLSELVESISRRQESFPAASLPWLAKTTHTALLLANNLPPHVAPALAADCDAILNAIAVVELAQSPFAPSRPTLPTTHRTAKEFQSPFASDAIAHNKTTKPNELAADVPAARPARSQSGSFPEESERQTTPEANNRLRAEDEPSTWSGRPTQPTRLPIEDVTLRVVPPTPLIVPEAGAPLPPRPSSHAPSRSAEIESPALLAQWQTASGFDAAAIENELARRGFGRLTKPLVDKYISKSPNDRLRLIDDVLNDSAAGARSWLFLLADDPHPDVRLSAITVMATTNDRALLDKAWQVAIRDRDPRIADLAVRLRDRQNGEQRR